MIKQPIPKLETARLLLREFDSDDAENLYALNLDPEVIRYTGDEAFKSIAAASTFLADYKYRDGFGRWAVIEKASGVFLGWCGLKYDQTTDECDVGFRFFKKYWNRGYATEAAKACLDYGFENLGLQQIIGRAANANTASIKVLQKIGLIYLKPLHCHHDEGGVYVIKNPNNSSIAFEAINWDTIAKTEHVGETGTSFWQTKQYEGLRIRRVDYSRGYFANHWCQKGHIVQCLEGSLVSELENGEKITLSQGMSYVVSDGLSSHRSYSENGVKLLIIDGNFLK